MVDHFELEKSISDLGIDIIFADRRMINYEERIDLKNQSCLEEVIKIIVDHYRENMEDGAVNGQYTGKLAMHYSDEENTILHYRAICY
jgi:hypothetical protein